MDLKFHYEVETLFDKEKEEVMVTTFKKHDPLKARKEAFSFLRNYINILKNENQVNVDTKQSSPRNHAQFRYDLRTENFEHELNAYFVSKLEFKNPTLQDGIKIYLVLDKDFKVKNEILAIDERLLIYQLGNYTEESLIAMIDSLVKEYEIHTKIDSYIDRNSSEIDITPYLHLLNKNNDYQESQTILKTPFSLYLLHWEKLFSAFNTSRIYSLKLIKTTFEHHLNYEFEKLENYDFKTIYKTAASMFYTDGGFIALKINPQENEAATKSILSNLNKGLLGYNKDNKLRDITYELVNCKSKSGNYFMCLCVKKYSWKANYKEQIPTEIYIREDGYIEKITDVNEIIEYLTNNF